MVDADVAQWLRSLPVAPEYRPSEAEFADPISFISKIEEQAQQFGICKIVPPLAKASKKTALSNLSKALGHRAHLSTRKQQLGWKPKPGSDYPTAHLLAWQRGETYTLDEFETKAKAFARSLLGTCKEVPALGLESLFWRAVDDEPMFTECASDIPGSAFTETVPLNERPDRGRIKEREVNPGWKLANSSWNARHMAHSRGSLLQFMPESVPGVTSPLLQVVMLYSWFGWQLEDHELHSLDYLHFGSPKTWYSVPAGAAAALEELVRVHGYGLQLDTKEALTLLGEKTTILSPEILASAGIPCCRLVQHAGEFVVTFPRGYHFAFSHGFSCSEAVNFATPAWLEVAKEAAYRRTLMTKSAMLCHEQLLYQLALTYSRRNDMDCRSSRLNLRNRPSETVKREFVRSIRTNYHFFQKLKKCGETKCILLEAGKDSIDDLPNLGIIDSISLLSFVCESMESIGNTFYSKMRGSRDFQFPQINWGTSSCRACGVRCFSCVVILQPTSKSFLDAAGTGRSSDTAEEDAPQPCTLCPVHALQIRSYLQAHGGSRVLVVCHPDYALFEQHAKQYAEDMNIGGATELVFEKARPEDFAIIELASSHRSGEIWVTRLQLDFYAQQQSGKDATTISSEEEQEEEEQEEEEQEEKAAKPLKEKKCWIVGRWCGRVWRYDQTSFLLGGSRKGPLLLKGKVVDSHRAGCLNRAELLEPVKQNIRKRKRTQASPSWRIQRQTQFGCCSLPVNTGTDASPISRNIQPDSDFCQKQEVPEEVTASQSTGSQVPVKEMEEEPCFGSAENVEQGVQAADDNSSQDSKLSQSGSVWHDVPIACTPSFDPPSSGNYIGALDGVHETNKDRRGIQHLFCIQRKKRAARRKCTNAARHFYTSRLKDLFGNGSRASEEEEIKSRDEEMSSFSTEDESDDEFVPPSPVHYTRSTVKSNNSDDGRPGGPGKRRKQNEDEEETEDEESRHRTKHRKSSASEVSETSEEEGSFKCDFEGGCTMSFKTRRELLLHKKNVCTVGDCAKQLCSHSYLLQHYRVHLDARPLKCPWKGCRKTFKWSWARTEHIRVHTGERPYACADCGKSYRFVSDFSRHKRTTGHTGSSL